MIYLMLLINTIWTSFTISSSWLISSITCLFKTKDLEVKLKIIEVFQLWQPVQK